MSWRDRRQDVYVNNGKVTTTTITPAEAPGYWRVTQFKKYMGRQGEFTFEGVFGEKEAEMAFVDLVSNAQTETVKAPGNGNVEHVIVDDLDEWGEAV
jgi:hypothetical protein